MKITSLVFIALILFSACKDESNCLKSTGRIVKEKREMGPFSTITVYDNIDLIVSNTGVQSIEIEAGEHIQDGITTEVTNYNLTIRNENKCNWLRSYDKKIKVFINQPGLVEMYNLSNGTITNIGQLVMDSLLIHNYGNGQLVMDIKCNKLKVDTNFFGDLDFSGEATEVWAHCFRLARLNTKNLKCQNLHMISDAEADVTVSAENKLSGVVRNKGNVYYYGNPSVLELEDKGDGDFVKK